MLQRLSRHIVREDRYLCESLSFVGASCQMFWLREQGGRYWALSGDLVELLQMQLHGPVITSPM